eukprot:jgi/Bigna1/90927/estExt_fgenesh1_pg.C_830022
MRINPMHIQGYMAETADRSPQYTDSKEENEAMGSSRRTPHGSRYRVHGNPAHPTGTVSQQSLVSRIRNTCISDLKLCIASPTELRYAFLLWPLMPCTIGCLQNAKLRPLKSVPDHSEKRRGGELAHLNSQQAEANVSNVIAREEGSAKGKENSRANNEDDGSSDHTATPRVVIVEEDAKERHSNEHPGEAAADEAKAGTYVMKLAHYDNRNELRFSLPNIHRPSHSDFPFRAHTAISPPPLLRQQGKKEANGDEDDEAKEEMEQVLFKADDTARPVLRSQSVPPLSAADIRALGEIKEGSDGYAPKFPTPAVLLKSQSVDTRSKKHNPALPDERSEDWKALRKRLMALHHNPGKGSSEKIIPSPDRAKAMRRLHRKAQKKGGLRGRALSSPIPEMDATGKGGRVKKSFFSFLCCTSEKNLQYDRNSDPPNR